MLPSEVRVEVRAQIKWFEDHVGHPPPHLDGHQHCHMYPTTMAPVAAVARLSGVRRIRVSSEHGSPTALCAACAAVSNQAPAARLIFRAAGLITTDAFVGLGFCGAEYVA